MPFGQESISIDIDRRNGPTRPVHDCILKSGYMAYNRKGDYFYCKANTKIIEARQVKKTTGVEQAHDCVSDCGDSSDCL